MKQDISILCVDDEESVRRALTMLLVHIGHEVCAVESGEAALKELAQRKFDVVMTDFSMPGMHGDQLVARVRQLLPTQPIIMATAFAEDFKVFGELDERADAVLPKPFTLQNLRDAIEGVLKKYQPAPARFPSGAAQAAPA